MSPWFILKPESHLYTLVLVPNPTNPTPPIRNGGGRGNGKKPAPKGGGSGSTSGPCFAYGNKKFGNKGPGCTNRKCQYRHSLTESEKKKAKKGNL